MSDLRVALVAEGPTDFEIISAALKAICGHRTFVLTQLQPEKTLPALGTGWGGVMRWCMATGDRHQGSLDLDPTLESFDLLILHLDLDVALGSYADCGAEIQNIANERGWATPPCACPCPPASDTASALTLCLRQWLGQALPGDKTVICLPGQSSGSWLAAATLAPGHGLLANLECNPNAEHRLSSLPLAERIRKKPREYRDAAPRPVSKWAEVKGLCSQSQAFENAVLAAI